MSNTALEEAYRNHLTALSAYVDARVAHELAKRSGRPRLAVNELTPQLAAFLHRYPDPHDYGELAKEFSVSRNIMRSAARKLVRDGTALFAKNKTAIRLRPGAPPPVEAPTPAAPPAAPPAIVVPPELFADIQEGMWCWRTTSLKYATRILRVIRQAITEEGVMYEDLLFDRVKLAPTDMEEDEGMHLDRKIDALSHLRDEGFIAYEPAPPPNEEHPIIRLTGKEWPLPDEFDDMGEAEGNDADGDEGSDESDADDEEEQP